jgi:putative heme-binding domain-containing protein
MKNLARCPAFSLQLGVALLSIQLSLAGEQTGPLSPEESAKSFTTFDDLQIEQVLAEPIVRQPLHLSWDERGRLWVVQYLQYPAPAGLTIMSKDQFWRAVYDKVPPPPPNHFKGADKITIHEDTDGDGKFDKHTTFIEGLNIVTSIAHGRGGVWILNPPYLLFYADKNHDDVPDGDPIVHLAGFGLEDTHSVANSLRWGPDGWLYGAHGSTVTANIVRPGLDEKPIARIMGQAIWRYHPETRRFEVFAEGGGNAFGLEIDDEGRIFSGHNGGNTRGFHYVQGGYLQKGFEKHGPLSNPYSFGYFKQMAGTSAERFTHTFVIYGGDALPERYNGNIFGAEPLQGRIVFSELLRDGSSFKTRDAGYAVTSTDKYFRPVDIKVGPDGAIYIADWYDRQVTHTHNYEGNIDKSNGRIYRLSKKGGKPHPFSTDRLRLSNLADSNRAVRQNTLRLIADRAHDPARADQVPGPALKKTCLEQTGQYALECLWAFNLTAGLDDSSALEFLDHKDPFVRLWTIRLLGDSGHFTEAVEKKVLAIARTEPHIEVRSQLACTAKRLSATQGLPIVKTLLSHSEDANDIHIPLLLWWALESKAESDRDAVLAFFEDRSIWNLPIIRSTILDRIMKRYAIAGTVLDLRTCARLLELAPDREKAQQLLVSFEKAYEGRSIGVLPKELREAIGKAGGGSMTLAIRQGDEKAAADALKLIKDPATPKQKRSELVQVFGDVKYASALPVLLSVAHENKNPSLQKEAIAALGLYADSTIAEELITIAPGISPDAQLAAYNVLASRPASASALIKAVEQKKIARKQVPLEIVEKLRSDETLAASVDQAFGPKPTLDKAALDAKLHSLASTIQGGVGNPFEGQKNFQLACGTCHRLFGEGGEIGPDLTTYKRDDLETMLMNIVNPSGEIREGYENMLVETKDGRTLSGFLAEKYDDAIVLRDLAGEKTLIGKNDFISMKSAGRSLMPEGLLEAFDDQQLRDLFAYLRSTQPLVKRQ